MPTNYLSLMSILNDLNTTALISDFIMGDKLMLYIILVLNVLHAEGDRGVEKEKEQNHIKYLKNKHKSEA